MVTGLDVGPGIQTLKTAFSIAKEAKDLMDMGLGITFKVAVPRSNLPARYSPILAVI